MAPFLGLIRRGGKYSGAVFDEDTRFRYLLWRQLTTVTPERVCLFIGVNPSTADERINDNTIVACFTFAKAWGYSMYLMANVFAYRSTNPKMLYPYNRAPDSDIIGRFNNAMILGSADRAELIVCAWGKHGTLDDRDKDVMKLLEPNAAKLRCLGVNKDGTPVHPLYQPRDRQHIPYTGR